jgi:hypothetical protein
MDFGEILTKAWKIIWKFKILWLFGILSSCGQGGGGGGGGSSNSGVQFSGGDANIPPGMRDFFNNFEYFFNNIQGWQIAALVIGLFLFFLILSLIFTAISTVGKLGLIQGTVTGDELLDSEMDERLTFGELFSSGKPYFWRVFGFNLLAGLAIFVVVLLLFLPMIGIIIVTFGIGALCLIPLVCILIPASWLVSVLIEQVNLAMVIEDLSIRDGLRRGWEVFRDNLGNMIVMGLILVLGGGLVSILLALPLIFVMFPIIVGIIGGSASGSDLWFGGGFAAAALCCVVYLPVLIVLGGILQAYIKSAWTLTYLRLTRATDEVVDLEAFSLEEGEASEGTT